MIEPSDGEDRVSVAGLVLSQYQRATDGQTDGETRLWLECCMRSKMKTHLTNILYEPRFPKVYV